MGQAKSQIDFGSAAKATFHRNASEKPPTTTFALVFKLLFAEMPENSSVVSGTCLARTKMRRSIGQQPGTKSGIVEGPCLSFSNHLKETTRALCENEVAGEVSVWSGDEHHLVDVTDAERSLQGEVLSSPVRDSRSCDEAADRSRESTS